jgi:transposase-like protein
MTKKQKKDYLKSVGTKCPYCKSENISTDPIDSDGSIGWANVRCLDCKKDWVDQWKLVNVEEGE